MKIAVLLTCFNRKEKTLKSLESLYSALFKYNENSVKIELSVFLTDDGSTDGTGKSIKQGFPDKKITIIRNNGRPLFWAGGMRLAWNSAFNESNVWDYFLLLNDDTIVFENLFDELFKIEDSCIAEFNIKGVYSGITCSSVHEKETTYGGSVWTNKFLGNSRLLNPNGKPQLCDVANANILMVSSNVVDKIGIFSELYQHGLADYDYSISAKKAGFPVLVSSCYCGVCDNDHYNKTQLKEMVTSMSLKQRIQYFKSPKNSSSDYLKFIKKNSPLRYILVFFGRLLNIYMPKLYYRLSDIRLNVFGGA